MRFLKAALGALVGVVCLIVGKTNAQAPPSGLTASISGPQIVNVSLRNTQQVMVDGSSSTGFPTIYRWSCLGDCRPSFVNSIQATNIPVLNVDLTSYNDITNPTSTGISLVVCTDASTCSTNPSKVKFNIFPMGVFPNGTMPNGTEPVFPNGTMPNGTEPVFPNGTEPVFPNRTEPVFPNGTEPVFPNRTEPVFPNIIINGPSDVSVNSTRGDYRLNVSMSIPSNFTRFVWSCQFCTPDIVQQLDISASVINLNLSSFASINQTVNMIIFVKVCNEQQQCIPARNMTIHVVPTLRVIPPPVNPNGTVPNRTDPVNPPRDDSITSTYLFSMIRGGDVQSVIANEPSLIFTLDGSQSVNQNGLISKYSWGCMFCLPSLNRSLNVNKPTVVLDLSDYNSITQPSMAMIGLKVCDDKACSPRYVITMIINPKPTNVDGKLLFKVNVLQMYPKTKLPGEIPAGNRLDLSAIVEPMTGKYRFMWFENTTNAALPSNGPTISIPAERLQPNTSYVFVCVVRRTLDGFNFFTQRAFTNIYIKKIRNLKGEIVVSYNGSQIIPGQTDVSLSLTMDSDPDDSFMYAWGFILRDVPIVAKVTSDKFLTGVVLPSEDPMRNTHLKLFVNVLDADSGMPVGRIVGNASLGKMFQNNQQMRTETQSIVNQTQGIIASGDVSEGARKLLDAATVLDDSSIPREDRKNLQMNILSTMAQMGEIVRQDPTKMKNTDMTYMVMNIRKAVSVNVSEAQNENATHYVELTKKSLKPIMEQLFNRQKTINLASDDETLTTDKVNELTQQSLNSVDSLMKLKVSKNEIGDIYNMIDLTTRAAIVQSPAQTVEFSGERFKLNGAVGSPDNFPTNISSMVKLDNSSLQGYLDKFMDRNDPQPLFLRVFDSKDDPYNHAMKPTSNIVSFTVSYMGNGSEIKVSNLQAPIQIRIPLTNDTPILNKTVRCAFWNTSSQSWDTNNIVTKEGGRLCETTHLTDFSLVLTDNPVAPITTTCASGQYLNGNTCSNCPANTYRQTPGATSITQCLACPSGKESVEGSSSCTDSPAPIPPPPEESSALTYGFSLLTLLPIMLV